MSATMTITRPWSRLSADRRRRLLGAVLAGAEVRWTETHLWRAVGAPDAGDPRVEVVAVDRTETWRLGDRPREQVTWTLRRTA